MQSNTGPLASRFASVAVGNALRVVTAAALAIGAAACSRTDTYTLATANGDTLPVIVSADSVCLVQLMGGSVALEKKTFSMDYQLRKVCPTGSTPLPDPGSFGRYEMTPATIVFRDSTGALMNRGEVRQDTLIIPGSVHTLRFVRSN